MDANQIKSLRESLELSQAEFAALCGLKTKGAISHLEAGRKVPAGPLAPLLRLLGQLPRKKILEFFRNKG